MAIRTFTAKEVFVSGRGNVSGNVAKTDAECMSEESEMMQGGMEAVPGDAGAKPVFPTGDTPFHSGRGLGRGHGTDK